MPSSHAQLLLEKYRTKGILIDTNLMLLIIVGAYNPQRVLTFKRTLKYTLGDLALMTRMMNRFGRCVTTPNILTEVDNLARQLPEDEHEAITIASAQLIANSFEVYFPSLSACVDPNYVLLGLTDCTTAMAAKDLLVVTDDFRLSNSLSGLGHDVMNINHIRTQSWF
jgi:hypothetical protein